MLNLNDSILFGMIMHSGEGFRENFKTLEPILMSKRKRLFLINKQQNFFTINNMFHYNKISANISRKNYRELYCTKRYFIF